MKQMQILHALSAIIKINFRNHSKFLRNNQEKYDISTTLRISNIHHVTVILW